MPRRFTQDEDALLISLARGQGTATKEWREWVELFEGRTSGALRKRWENHLRAHNTDAVANAAVQADPLAEYTPEFLDKKHTQVPDWRDIIAAGMEQQSVVQALDGTQRIATVQIASPALICHSGDWHLGSVATDYPSWKSHIETILSTDGCYMTVLGDGMENMRTFRNLAAVLSQVLQPKLQACALESIVLELCEKGKLLSLMTGNHEGFDEKCFGEMLTSYIYRNSSAPQFDNRGILQVMLRDGDKTYEYPHLLFHKSRYSSFLNSLHGAKREHQLSFPGRIVAGAHHHTPGIEYYWRYTVARELGYPIGGMVLLVKCSSFNASCAYSWRGWGEHYPPVMPCVLLWRNSMLAFHSLDLGVTMLRAIQNGHVEVTERLEQLLEEGM